METRLLSVLWWFCASILIGILVVLAFDFFLEIPLPVSESLGLVVGPTVVMVVVAIRRPGLDVPGIVRTIGAVAGWLSFVSLYLNEEFSQLLGATFRGAGHLVLMVLAPLTLGMVAAGLVLSETFLRMARSRAGP